VKAEDALKWIVSEYKAMKRLADLTRLEDRVELNFASRNQDL